ncbi:MAG: CheW protein [Frankiales bacterium]|nr:CheW protein [Frankiales bacterium]
MPGGSAEPLAGQLAREVDRVVGLHLYALPAENTPVTLLTAPVGPSTSAAAVPATAAAEHAGPIAPTELVVVRLGGCRYALPMSAVAEVGRPPGLTRVPGLPSWVAGVANWRGRVLAVLDLRSLLAAGTGSLDRRGRLVVLAHGGVRVGLLVEAVAGGAVLDPETLEQSLAHLPESTGALLAGQVTDREGPYGLLDLDAVFALASSLPRARRAG